MMPDTLTVRLGADLARALRDEARESGLPKGEIARQAIAERLKKRPAPSVIAKHFGSVRGPADLSTNKAYPRRLWSKRLR